MYIWEGGSGIGGWLSDRICCKLQILCLTYMECIIMYKWEGGSGIGG